MPSPSRPARRASRVAALTLSATVAALAMTPGAEAKPRKAKHTRAAKAQRALDATGGGHVFGDAVAGPNHIRLDVSRPAGSAAVTPGSFGPFVAYGNLVDLFDHAYTAVPVHIEGPTTCLEVKGNRAALFYPVTKGDPSVLQGMGIYIYLQDGGPGGPDYASYLPVPLSSVQGCSYPNDDAASTLVTEGDIVVQPAS